MTDKEIGESHLPRSTAIEHSTKPSPKEHDADDFHSPRPPASSGTFGVKSFFIKVGIGVGVEIEAGKGHDDVEQFVLDAEEDLGEPVEFHGTFIIR